MLLKEKKCARSTYLGRVQSIYSIHIRLEDIMVVQSEQFIVLYSLLHCEPIEILFYM